MNEQEIKVYKDAYADASYAKIGFKGKIVNEKGVIYCPYKKPSKFRQFINWIANKFAIFKSKCQAEELIEGNKDMADKLNNLTKVLISTFIVNQLGINLCAVKSIDIDRQEDGQIKQIKIDFIPAAE